MSQTASGGVRVVNDRVPGRTRVSVGGLFRRPAVAGRLQRLIACGEGIRSVRADCRTGNVLVEHDPALAQTELLSMLTQAASGAAGGAWDDDVARAASGRTSWHQLPAHELTAELNTHAMSGLTSSEAASRLERQGPNVLTPEPQRSQLAMLAEQFVSLPVALLGGSIGLSLATRSFFEAAVTAGVVAANGGIGYLTESGAQRLIGRLTRTEDTVATVIRDGVKGRIAARLLVPGDVVVLRRGDPVPADVRLTSEQSLSVNEALLTGESAPQRKQAASMLPAGTPLAERSNLVFMGTTVVGGSGRGVVVATGADTEIGTIQTLAGITSAPRTPMERDLDKLGRDLALGALAVCGLAFGLGVLRGHPALHILKSAIALAVAAVPEGLPAVATSTLALGLRRMRTEHLLVRRLEAVEALGAVQTLCLDKTGTLTENRMTVTAVAVDGAVADGDAAASALPAHRHLARLALLACETPVADGSAETLAQLSGTERALVEYGLRLGIDPAALAERVRRISARLRDDTSNFVMVAHQSADGPLLAVKGRPGEVLALCRARWHQERVVLLDEMQRREIERENELLSAQGLRVLGVAFSSGTDSLDARRTDLVWCGHMALSDPIRPGARSTIARLQGAGIRTVMITGDQGPTAVRVAEALGLSGGEPLEILDAAELESLDDAVLSALAARTHVFTRVSPSRKLEIVQALQQAGLVVAMTGDGINDGPALKAADVGIAMGRGGARIARDVADVVIEDDDLEHLLRGISDGRTILANIRKSVHFLLATNLSEIFVVFAEILGGANEVETPMELFWINLVTDVFPSLGLALEPAAPDVMTLPPRSRHQPLIDASYYRRLGAEAGIIGAAALAAHAYGLARYGPGPSTRGVTFLAMVSAQLLHALTCRTDRFQRTAPGPLTGNRTLIAALAGSSALQVLPFVVPPLRRLLGVAPLRGFDVAVAGTAAAASFAANQLLLSRDRGYWNLPGRNVAPARAGAVGKEGEP